MRLFLTFIAVVIGPFANGQVINTAEIRFDGFYQTKAEIDKRDNDTSYSYLRFYPNGKVISVASEGNVNDLKEWFNLENKHISIGSYEIRGKKIYFSTTRYSGSVVYQGKLKKPYYVVLKWKSLINGHSDREKYYFISIADLK